MASRRKRLVICLRNRGHEVSLEPRKIYPVLPDKDAAKHGQLRVIDESGEDYLYPEEFFAEVELPQQLRRAVLAAV
jgi:hypothetical protein